MRSKGSRSSATGGEPGTCEWYEFPKREKGAVARLERRPSRGLARGGVAGRGGPSPVRAVRRLRAVRADAVSALDCAATVGGDLGPLAAPGGGVRAEGVARLRVVRGEPGPVGSGTCCSTWSRPRPRAGPSPSGSNIPRPGVCGAPRSTGSTGFILTSSGCPAAPRLTLYPAPSQGPWSMAFVRKTSLA